jgi:hypothetical protein
MPGKGGFLALAFPGIPDDGQGGISEMVIQSGHVLLEKALL